MLLHSYCRPIIIGSPLLQHSVCCIMSYLVVCSPLPTNIKEMKVAWSTNCLDKQQKVTIDLLLWNVTIFKLNAKTETFTVLTEDPIRDSLDIRAETENTRSLQLITNHVLEDSFIRLSENISSYNQNAKKNLYQKPFSKQKCWKKVLLNTKL